MLPSWYRVPFTLILNSAIRQLFHYYILLFLYPEEMYHFLTSMDGHTPIYLKLDQNALRTMGERRNYWQRDERHLDFST